MNGNRNSSPGCLDLYQKLPPTTKYTEFTGNGKTRVGHSDSPLKNDTSPAARYCAI